MLGLSLRKTLEKLFHIVSKISVNSIIVPKYNNEIINIIIEQNFLSFCYYDF